MMPAYLYFIVDLWVANCSGSDAQEGTKKLIDVHHLLLTALHKTTGILTTTS